jgi:methionyl-tRNA synthetase
MQVIEFKESDLFEAYGLICQKLFPNDMNPQMPFGSLRATVRPLTASVIHNHHELEVFYIISGEGVVEVEDVHRKVSAGDIVSIPAFKSHVLKNLDAQTPIDYLAIWWEDLSAIAKTTAAAAKHENILISATPPTPNGDLHLGHLSGPYVAADIYKRFSQIQGDKAHYITGADVNQSYVPLRASQLETQPLTLAKDNSVAIQSVLSQAQATPDLFYQPYNHSDYNGKVQQFFQTLFEKEALIEKDAPSLHDPDSGQYLFQAMVSGQCPHCGASSDGNACEQCGQPNQITDLIDPISKLSNKPAVLGTTKRLYFHLSRYELLLRDYYDTVSMPVHLKVLCQKMLADGLPDIAVSHPYQWGIKHTINGFEDQIIYVWAEMAAGYLFAADQLNPQQALTDAWQKYDKVVQFFGFDNGYFHAVLMPALWLAFEPKLKLPEAFVVNEFLNLDGEKFSTSRNHLIWGKDLLSQHNSDVVRLFLAKNRPQVKQENYRQQDFDQYLDLQLNGQWQQWLTGVWQRQAQTFDQTICEPGAWNNEHKMAYQQVKDIVAQVKLNFQPAYFSPANTVTQLEVLVSIGLSIQAQEVHSHDFAPLYDELRTTMAMQLAIAKVLAMCAYPIMPTFAQRLWSELGLEQPIEWTDEVMFLTGGVKIAPLNSSYFSQ